MLLASGPKRSMLRVPGRPDPAWLLSNMCLAMQLVYRMAHKQNASTWNASLKVA